MKKALIMVGTNPDGMGGIARVVKLWMESGLFQEYDIKYLHTTGSPGEWKLFSLFSSLLRFLWYSIVYKSVYIHTASYNSFYRKSIFILLSVLLKKKIVLHIHPSFFFTFINGFNGLKKRFFFSLLNRVDTFVVLTQEMRSNMKSLFPGKPVHLLRNPVSIDAMKNKHDIKREKNTLLFLGWYTQGKGVYDLVDAVSLLATNGCGDIKLDFYGTKGREGLHRYVSEKGLTHCITVNGWADDDQKRDALYKASLFILPSHTEGIPNVILEAMAARAPIISTLVGGLKEVLEDGNTAIIVEPGNPRDLSEKIKFALNDSALRNRIAENAYQSARQLYDLPKIRNDLSRVLKELP
ncbi:MAG: glycosyltransferase family 4 protein [Deltaproteobacteria bacterium]|nr:glycosyltransferase family 4 protein [Deltaproteobacteria bacterium]